MQTEIRENAAIKESWSEIHPAATSRCWRGKGRQRKS